MSKSTPRQEIAMRSIGPMTVGSTGTARNPTNATDRDCNFRQRFWGENLRSAHWKARWPKDGLPSLGLLVTAC